MSEGRGGPEPAVQMVCVRERDSQGAGQDGEVFKW